jgi:hypothetical protein
MLLLNCLLIPDIMHRRTARDTIPENIRKAGLIITYATGINAQRTEQFFQGDVNTGWTSNANWKTIKASNYNASTLQNVDLSRFVYGDNSRGTSYINTANDIWKSGFWFSSQGTPTPGDYHILHIQHTSTHNNSIQIATHNNTAITYSRVRISTGWKPWVRLTPAENYAVYEVNMGSLPASGEKSVPHGIPNFIATKVRNIRGVAYRASDAIPLPLASIYANGNIMLAIRGNNVVVSVGQNMSSFNECRVIIEYDL